MSSPTFTQVTRTWKLRKQYYFLCPHSSVFSDFSKGVIHLENNNGKKEPKLPDYVHIIKTNWKLN